MEACDEEGLRSGVDDSGDVGDFRKHGEMFWENGQVIGQLFDRPKRVGTSRGGTRS